MKEMTLKDKVAIVTGGIRGIGRSIVDALIKEGACVLVAYVEDASIADPEFEVIKMMAAENDVKVINFQGDISKIPEIERMFDLCEDQLGKVDIFIANAGANLRKQIIDTTEAEFDRVFDVNAKGTFFCVKECGTRMNDNGRIVLISSSSVPFPVDGHGVYTPSKAAVQMLAKVAAIEYGARGITVNAIQPGVTMTAMAKDVLTEDFMDEVREKTPLKRIGKAEDVANAVVMVCEPKASWVSGQVILANGGSNF